MNRIKIGIPTRGDMVADTAFCLAAMTAYEATRGELTGFISPRGSLLPILRHHVVERAIEQDATHILWIDSDMTFPRDGLRRLLAHGEPVVACNCPTRRHPARPTAVSMKGLPIFETGQKGLERVRTVGFGFCLTEVSVFKEMPRPWFSEGWEAGRREYTGEDCYFCLNAPCPILIDHDLSPEIGHVGSYHFTHEDTLEAGQWQR